MAAIFVTAMTGEETEYSNAHIEFPVAKHLNDPTQQDHIDNPGWWSLVISRGDNHDTGHEEERLAIYSAGTWKSVRIV